MYEAISSNELAVIEAAIELMDIHNARKAGVPVSTAAAFAALRDAVSELHSEHDGRYTVNWED